MIRTRLQNLRGLLREYNVEAIIIESNRNRFYLSGFTGMFGYIIVTQNEATLFTSRLELDHAKDEVSELYVVRAGSDLSQLFTYIKEANIKSIIIEDSLTLARYNLLKSPLVDVDLKITTGIIDEMRQIKDQNELNDIRTACRITDNAFSHILNMIEPNIREKDVAIELETFLLKCHNVRPAFDMVVASGVRGSLPHGHPSEKLIIEGDLVTIDFGVLYKGYMSDMTRTIAVGEPNEKMKNLYEIVLEAQQASIDKLKPGILVSDIHDVGRDIIADAGYAGYIHTASGHGIGLELHESPIITSFNKSILKPGTVITIEPGINIPGVGGVRIEDTVLVNEKGYEVLTQSLKDLIILR